MVDYVLCAIDLVRKELRAAENEKIEHFAATVPSSSVLESVNVCALLMLQFKHENEEREGKGRHVM